MAPSRVPSEAPRGAPETNAAAPGSALRVLVGEDSDDSREMLVALLRLWGHDPDEAADAETALGRCGARRPDVALVDVGLPDIDGYELARRIRASSDSASAPGPRIFLVAITGYG